MLFSQQKHDAPARARMISGLIGGDYVKWVGHLNLFWLWAANTGKDGQAPEGRLDGPDAPKMLVGLIDYRGKVTAAAVAEAWITAGVLAQTETGLRARGIDCYAPSVEAKAARSEAASHAATVRWEKERAAKEAACIASAQQTACATDAPACEPHAPRTADAMPNDAYTYTYTQTETETEIEKVEVVVPAGAGEPPPPAVELWDRMQEARVARFGELPAEKQPTLKSIDKLLGPPLAKLGAAATLQAYVASFEDPWIQSRKPPGAVQAFASQWEQHVVAAPRPAPPSAPAPRTLPATPAGRLWGRVLDQLAADGFGYSVEWVEKLTPAALRDGVLVLQAADEFFRDWVAEQYQELLARTLAKVGGAQSIRLDVAADEEAA